MADALAKTFSKQLVGQDVRGVAVHEAARIRALADADAVEDRGSHELDCLDGEWHLSALVVDEVNA